MRKDERVDTEERRERDVSISCGVASGRHGSVQGDDEDEL